MSESEGLFWAFLSPQAFAVASLAFGLTHCLATDVDDGDEDAEDATYEQEMKVSKKFDKPVILQRVRKLCQGGSPGVVVNGGDS